MRYKIGGDMSNFIDKDLFCKILTTIQEHDKTNRILSDAIEQHLCTASFCYVDHGCKLSDVLREILVKAFDLEKGEFFGDDISWWLYEDVEKKFFYPDGFTLDVTDINDFYSYCVNHKSLAEEHKAKEE